MHISITSIYLRYIAVAYPFQGMAGKARAKSATSIKAQKMFDKN